MIEILGVSIAWESIGFLIAFIASEVIGETKLKENSVAALVKSLVAALKPTRKEDEKVAEIKRRLEELSDELRQLGE